MLDVLADNSFFSIRFESLVSFSAEHLDELTFGVVGLKDDGHVTIYNATEERYSGLPRSSVMSMHFFENVAQCMNNFMVAQRFEDEPDMDALVDYVLTFRMRPTRVRLRLLQKSGAALHFVLIQR